MIEIREQVKEKAMDNIDKAQERQKKNYDVKHQPLLLKEGDTVLLCQSFASLAEESVQVHFTGKNHWVCSSSVGGYVRVYNSAASRDLT